MVKKKQEYKSGYEQHLAEQKEGRKIEREERQNKFAGPKIKAIRIDEKKKSIARKIK